jgi:hypothetical protein
MVSMPTARPDAHHPVEPVQKPVAVMLPDEVVQVDAERVEAKPAAQPSSRSMVAASKLSRCHISMKFTAVEGRKLNPQSQGGGPPPGVRVGFAPTVCHRPLRCIRS